MTVGIDGMAKPKVRGVGNSTKKKASSRSGDFGLKKEDTRKKRNEHASAKEKSSISVSKSDSISEGLQKRLSRRAILKISIRAGDRASQCQVLKVTQVNQKNEIVSLGLLKVRWRRDVPLTNDSDGNIVVTTFQLLSCCVLELPVRVRAEIPATNTVLMPMRVQFGLENRTIYPQELLIQIESAPHFMISGQIKLRLRLLPGSPQLLQYILLPLHAGHLALPRLRLTLSTNNTSSSEEQQTLRLHMEEKMLRQIPTHVFVVPSGKRNSDDVRDSTLAEQLVPSL